VFVKLRIKKYPIFYTIMRVFKPEKVTYNPSFYSCNACVCFRLPACPHNSAGIERKQPAFVFDSPPVKLKTPLSEALSIKDRTILLRNEHGNPILFRGWMHDTILRIPLPKPDVYQQQLASVQTRHLRATSSRSGNCREIG